MLARLSPMWRTALVRGFALIPEASKQKMLLLAKQMSDTDSGGAFALENLQANLTIITQRITRDALLETLLPPVRESLKSLEKILPDLCESELETAVRFYDECANLGITIDSTTFRRAKEFQQAFELSIFLEKWTEPETPRRIFALLKPASDSSVFLSLLRFLLDNSQSNYSVHPKETRTLIDFAVGKLVGNAKSMPAENLAKTLLYLSRAEGDSFEDIKAICTELLGRRKSLSARALLLTLSAYTHPQPILYNSELPNYCHKKIYEFIKNEKDAKLAANLAGTYLCINAALPIPHRENLDKFTAKFFSSSRWRRARTSLDCGILCELFRKFPVESKALYDSFYTPEELARFFEDFSHKKCALLTGVIELAPKELQPKIMEHFDKHVAKRLGTVLTTAQLYEYSKVYIRSGADLNGVISMLMKSPGANYKNALLFDLVKRYDECPPELRASVKANVESLMKTEPVPRSTLFFASVLLGSHTDFQETVRSLKLPNLTFDEIARFISIQKPTVLPIGPGFCYEKFATKAAPPLTSPDAFFYNILRHTRNQSTLSYLLEHTPSSQITSLDSAKSLMSQTLKLPSSFAEFWSGKVPPKLPVLNFLFYASFDEMSRLLRLNPGRFLSSSLRKDPEAYPTLCAAFSNNKDMFTLSELDTLRKEIVRNLHKSVKKKDAKGIAHNFRLLFMDCLAPTSAVFQIINELNEKGVLMPFFEIAKVVPENPLSIGNPYRKKLMTYCLDFYDINMDELFQYLRSLVGLFTPDLMPEISLVVKKLIAKTFSLSLGNRAELLRIIHNIPGKYGFEFYGPFCRKIPDKALIHDESWCRLILSGVLLGLHEAETTKGLAPWTRAAFLGLSENHGLNLGDILAGVLIATKKDEEFDRKVAKALEKAQVGNYIRDKKTELALYELVKIGNKFSLPEEYTKKMERLWTLTVGKTEIAAAELLSEFGCEVKTAVNYKGILVPLYSATRNLALLPFSGEMRLWDEIKLRALKTQFAEANIIKLDLSALFALENGSKIGSLLNSAIGGKMKIKECPGAARIGQIRDKYLEGVREDSGRQVLFPAGRKHVSDSDSLVNTMLSL